MTGNTPDDDPNLRVLYVLVLLALAVTVLVLWTFTRAFA